MSTPGSGAALGTSSHRAVQVVRERYLPTSPRKEASTSTRLVVVPARAASNLASSHDYGLPEPRAIRQPRPCTKQTSPPLPKISPIGHRASTSPSRPPTSPTLNPLRRNWPCGWPPLVHVQLNRSLWSRLSFRFLGYFWGPPFVDLPRGLATFFNSSPSTSLLSTSSSTPLRGRARPVKMPGTSLSLSFNPNSRPAAAAFLATFLPATPSPAARPRHILPTTSPRLMSPTHLPPTPSAQHMHQVEYCLELAGALSTACTLLSSLPRPR